MYYWKEPFTTLKMVMSSNVIEVIRPISNFLFFFYEEIFTYKKHEKNTYANIHLKKSEKVVYSLVCFLCFLKASKRKKATCLFIFLAHRNIWVKSCLCAFYAFYQWKVVFLLFMFFRRMEMSERKVACLFFMLFKRIEISE